MTLQFVMDASAILAYLFDETGHDFVAERLDRGAVTCVNQAEVECKLLELGSNTADLDDVWEQLALKELPFDAPLVRRSALLRAPTRHLGLSLGDRACLAAAAEFKLTAVTSDRDWTSIQVSDIRVLSIR